MGLNIKNPTVERLAAEVAGLTGESKTEAIRKALVERKERLEVEGLGRPRREGLLDWLRSEVWPHVPRSARKPLTKQQREKILGYGPGGV